MENAAVQRLARILKNEKKLAEFGGTGSNFVGESGDLEEHSGADSDIFGIVAQETTKLLLISRKETLASWSLPSKSPTLGSQPQCRHRCGQQRLRGALEETLAYTLPLIYHVHEQTKVRLTGGPASLQTLEQLLPSMLRMAFSLGPTF